MIQKENLFVELLNPAEKYLESPDGVLAIAYQILVDENSKALERVVFPHRIRTWVFLYGRLADRRGKNKGKRINN